MLTKLASIGAPRALGICFDGNQAYGSLVTSTPLGAVEIAGHSVSFV